MRKEDPNDLSVAESLSILTRMPEDAAISTLLELKVVWDKDLIARAADLLSDRAYDKLNQIEVKAMTVAFRVLLKAHPSQQLDRYYRLKLEWNKPTMISGSALLDSTERDKLRAIVDAANQSQKKLSINIQNI